MRGSGQSTETWGTGHLLNSLLLPSSPPVLCPGRGDGKGLGGLQRARISLLLRKGATGTSWRGNTILPHLTNTTNTTVWTEPNSFWRQPEAGLEVSPDHGHSLRGLSGNPAMKLQPAPFCPPALGTPFTCTPGPVFPFGQYREKASATALTFFLKCRTKLHLSLPNWVRVQILSSEPALTQGARYPTQTAKEQTLSPLKTELKFILFLEEDGIHVWC